MRTTDQVSSPFLTISLLSFFASPLATEFSAAFDAGFFCCLGWHLASLVSIHIQTHGCRAIPLRIGLQGPVGARIGHLVLDFTSGHRQAPSPPLAFASSEPSQTFTLLHSPPRPIASAHVLGIPFPSRLACRQSLPPSTDPGYRMSSKKRRRIQAPSIHP